MRLTALAGAALAAASPACSSEETVDACRGAEFPQLTGRVVDLAELLPEAEEARLAEKLAAFETRTRHQMVVATVKTLQGREIDSYALCLGKVWGVGRKNHDDGLLLVVAPNERKVRIEVGYGLEAALTNDEAEAILQKRVLPRFKAGDMIGGIVGGADAIIEEAK